MRSESKPTSTFRQYTGHGWRRFFLLVAAVIGVIGVGGAILCFTPVPILMLFPESGLTTVMLMFLAPGLFYPFAIVIFLYGFQPKWLSADSVYFRISGPAAFFCLRMVGVTFGSIGFFGNPPQEVVDVLGASMLGFVALSITIVAVGAWESNLLIAMLGLGVIAAWAGITLATRHLSPARIAAEAAQDAPAPRTPRTP
ncbi:MAG: hypothetical protein H7146_08240 [Burkholderiaceae bacterium]|nr:hypothetical protein [Microbacteriaceae bacterium]